MYFHRLQQAAAPARPSDVERAAHALKGAARAISAGCVVETARILLQAARDGLINDANATADALVIQLALLDETRAGSSVDRPDDCLIRVVS